MQPLQKVRCCWLHFNLIDATVFCRHSKDMIKKLENAGLGFFVKGTETQQKLGKCLELGIALTSCVSIAKDAYIW